MDRTGGPGRDSYNCSCRWDVAASKLLGVDNSTLRSQVRGGAGMCG